MNTRIFVCENLKFIRSCYHLTQFEMADKLKIPPKSYQSYEERRCTPKLEAIVDISCKLNLSLDELVKVNMEETYTLQQILLLSVKPRTISKTEKDTTKDDSKARRRKEQQA